ncbi:MAG: leucyl aminopeptidase family protein [Lewinellaceae bacterium]|nr:leucyl aminopeptidase family protein [Lewinellaceae bacterium]
MTIKICDRKAPDALILPLVQDDLLPGRLAEIAVGAGVDTTNLQNDFKAEQGEVFVLYSGTAPARRLYLVGMGKKAGFTNVLLTARTFVHKFKSRLPAQTGIDLRHFPADAVLRLTDAAVTGVLLGLYSPGRYQTEGNNTKPAPVFGQDDSELQVLVPDAVCDDAGTAAGRGQVFAGVTREIMDLMNAPGNKKTPQVLCDWAKHAGEKAGFSVRILEKEDLIEQGLDALYAVGKGSPHAPALILLEYGDQTSAGPFVGLVGKGVTFDTGGVSLKPSANMHLMKSDMGGAAAVLGAFVAAAGLKIQAHLIGAIPVAENMIDGHAIKPGDVINSFSGKTIEVTDTDAEGRLILADALAYLLDRQKPDIVIDVATLTGSIIRAIGNHAGGLFTSNDRLADTLSKAGEYCGERLWRMPMWEEYGADLKSDVADLRNFTGKPMAECITAAKFIEHFTAGHPAWAHLDIAGMAYADTEFAKGKIATGYGIRLLTEFVEGFAAP